MANTANNTFPNDELGFVDTGKLQFRPESNSMGFNPFCRDFLLCKGVTVQTTSSKDRVLATEDNKISITHIAVVYANITTDAYMIAVNNNSLLNAKSDVYLLAQVNLTVNGVRMEIGETQKWSAPFPSILGITYNDTYYQIKLRQVGSLDDIEDIDRPTNLTAEYNYFDLVYTTIAGIPATLASLTFWIVVLVLAKSQQVQEGLPNDI